LKKRYLILSNSFYPDRNSASQLLEDLSSELIKKKFEVVVVCARSIKNSNYKFKNNDIKVINVYCQNIKSKNLFKRGFGEFFISKKLITKTDVFLRKYNPTNVICYAPPIFFIKYVKYLINNYNCKSFLILRDIFPYWLISCNIIKNYFIKAFLIFYFKSFVKLFDTVGVEAVSNINFLKKKNIYTKKIIHLPNWMNITNNKNTFRKTINEVIVFGGNIGLGQNIDKVCSFYNNIAGLKMDITFKIIGKNMSKDFLSNKLEKRTIIRTKICASLPTSKFDNELIKSSYGVISLDDRIESVNFPGRMLNYLRFGLPVILISNKENELSKFIIEKDIGVVIKNKINIQDEILKLRKIKKNFIKNKHHQKILFEYFDSKTITKILINSFDG